MKVNLLIILIAKPPQLCLSTPDKIVNNGYDVKIVMGLIAGENYEAELKDMYDKYANNLRIICMGIL